MKSNCSKCPYQSLAGGWDPCSDICDGCTTDPDTGWGGFTDHSIGKHFDSEEERTKYYEEHSGFNMEDYDSDEMD